MARTDHAMLEKFEKWGYRVQASKRRMNVAFWYQGAKNRAKQRGIPFSLKLEDVEIPDVCPILKIPLRFAPADPQTHRAADCTPSFDRLDNAEPYTKENVRVISTAANKMKSDMSLEQVTALYEYMRQ